MEINDEILRDFLVDAGAIVERLDAQLLALRRNPDDAALAYAMLRSFHTIRSGASLIDAVPLLALSDKAAAIVVLLGSGALRLDQQLFGVMSEVLEQLRAMFRALAAGRAMRPAPDELLARLLAHGDVSAAARGDFEISELLDLTDSQSLAPDAPDHDRLADAFDDDALMKRVVTDMLAAAMATPEAVEQEPVAAPPRQAVDDDAGEAESVDPAQPHPSAHNSRTDPSRGAAIGPLPDSVRVDTATLVAISAALSELATIGRELAGASAEIPLATAPLARLGRVTSELHACVAAARTQPLAELYGRFPALADRLAHDHGKAVALRLGGGDIVLDKIVLEGLLAPLEQVLVNAIEHGIEAPAARAAAGKPACGHIEIGARVGNGRLELTVQDDGRGLDVDQLCRAATDAGLLEPEQAARLGADERLGVLFVPGFSTVTSADGNRGPGLAAVRGRIIELGGTLEIESIPGASTTITVHLPLAQAPRPVYLLSVAGQRFALAAESVGEIHPGADDRVRQIGKCRMLPVGKRFVALFDLETALGIAGRTSDTDGELVVANLNGSEIGLAVDAVEGPHLVTVKPLGAMLDGLPGYAGAALCDDGQLALVLDLGGLLETAPSRPGLVSNHV